MENNNISFEEQLKKIAVDAFRFSQLRFFDDTIFHVTFDDWWEKNKHKYLKTPPVPSIPRPILMTLLLHDRFEDSEIFREGVFKSLLNKNVLNYMNDFVIKGCFPNKAPCDNRVVKVEEKKKYVQDFKVGENVKVNDGSYNYEKLTGKSRNGKDELFYKYAKIISNTETLQISYRVADDLHVKTLNLLLQFPNGKLIHCSDRCVGYR